MGVVLGQRLMDSLPAVYQSKQLKDFLSAFEETLFGPPGEERREEQKRLKSLEQHIDEIPRLFDPLNAPPELLPWLAQWAALTQYEGTPEYMLRRLIAEMIPLYRKRGTREYVEEMLRLYTGAPEAIVEEEDLPGMQVGVRSTIGHDTRLGEDPFRFSVQITFWSIPAIREERLRLIALAHMVISLAKPAHTHYRLSHNLGEERLGLVISVRSTVAIDTLLWSEHNDNRQ